MDEIEIPEAIREEVELPKKPKAGFLPIVGVIFCLGVAGGLLSMFLLFPKPEVPQAVKPANKSIPSKPKTKAKKARVTKPAQVSTADRPSKSKEELLGHLPYNVAPQSSLRAISADGRLSLRSAAADRFEQMQADARAEGIILVPISAFRTAEAQEQLFFGIKEQRVQDAAKRAEVSAPPGYSEHHTGYAIDIGDGNAPATNLETTFADTAAFAWLKENALKYSFELSFPPNNSQGVSYEPWHWRFVGDRDSLETFYKVRQ